LWARAVALPARRAGDGVCASGTWAETVVPAAHPSGPRKPPILVKSVAKRPLGDHLAAMGPTAVTKGSTRMERTTAPRGAARFLPGCPKMGPDACPGGSRPPGSAGFYPRRRRFLPCARRARRHRPAASPRAPAPPVPTAPPACRSSRPGHACLPGSERVPPAPASPRLVAGRARGRICTPQSRRSSAGRAHHS
jgi:hypothetical protein